MYSVYDSHVWEKWLGRKDSNLRIAESKSAALPLGDAPMKPKKGCPEWDSNPPYRDFKSPDSAAGLPGQQKELRRREVFQTPQTIGGVEGAGGEARTRTLVQNSILSRARLPFRHSGCF